MGRQNRGGCSDSTWPADPEILGFGGIALALGGQGSLQPQHVEWLGMAHLRVSETEVQSAVIREEAKSSQEHPVLEKGLSQTLLSPLGTLLNPTDPQFFFHTLWFLVSQEV